MLERACLLALVLRQTQSLPAVRHHLPSASAPIAPLRQHARNFPNVRWVERCDPFLLLLTPLSLLLSPLLPLFAR